VGFSPPDPPTFTLMLTIVP